MKKPIISYETIFFSLLYVLGVLGGYIGYLINQTYKEAVDGFIGLVTIYLIHLLFFSPKNLLKIIPNNILSGIALKYFIASFLMGVVFCWSVINIVTALYFYWGRFF